ncbi:uncharacterized protein K444DRAFT_663477 [Hyaloscypha bicolor E]|uniref:FAD dependent oxidoreductase domain-containing protein n=1 Tax=Hyaloscypha bicolor E TaxID=1095630 RepID=A0A2J6TA22_9HELO|nr:uncharacterized protein K444DRAFT_663477 [Hyaloscypha bicolor E]PMD59865.1 hypothetical protein K444DRAFT_663477 [Hyaloscypha bicolor E]
MGQARCNESYLESYGRLGEAENVLRSVIQAAVNLGVNYVEATVAKIAFDASGTCLGVETTAGDIFTSKHTVLCAGARTAELIAESAPENTELQVNGRMTAAAAIMCAFRVPENKLHKFKNAPIIVSPMGSTPGESIPPGELGLVKCTHKLSFTHKVYHEASKQTISVPPKRVTQSTWSQDVPEGLKNEVEILRGKIYGSWIESLKPEYNRMYWFVIPSNSHAFSESC